jgi:hypothetical protein
MDAHMHLLVGSMIVDEPSLRNYERIVLPKLMAGFIRHGITTIRSTADPLPYIAQIRESVGARRTHGTALADHRPDAYLAWESSCDDGLQKQSLLPARRYAGSGQ